MSCVFTEYEQKAEERGLTGDRVVCSVFAADEDAGDRALVSMEVRLRPGTAEEQISMLRSEVAAAVERVATLAGDLR